MGVVRVQDCCFPSSVSQTQSGHLTTAVPHSIPPDIKPRKVDTPFHLSELSRLCVSHRCRNQGGTGGTCPPTFLASTHVYYYYTSLTAMRCSCLVPPPQSLTAPYATVSCTPVKECIIINSRHVCVARFTVIGVSVTTFSATRHNKGI